jgi:hypothetical protein
LSTATSGTPYRHHWRLTGARGGDLGLQPDLR